MPWVFQPLLLCILNVLIDQSVHVRVDCKHWHEYTCGKLTFWIDDKDVADTLFDQPDAVASVRLKASYDREEWDLVVQRMAELAEKETSFAAQPRSDTMCATDQPVNQVIAEFENHLINQLVDQLVNQLVGGLCRQIALEFINFESTSSESIDRSFSLSSADSLTDEVFPDEEKEISAKDDDKDGLARQGNIEKEKSNEEHDEENDEENNDENNTAEHDATSDTSENSSSTSNDEGELAEETVFDILKEHALEQRNEAVEENPENKEPEPVRKESVEQVKKEPAEQLEKEAAEQDEKNLETKKENRKQQEELNLAKSTRKNPKEKKQDEKKQDKKKQDEKKPELKERKPEQKKLAQKKLKEESNGTNSGKNKLEKKQTRKDLPKKQEMKLEKKQTGKDLPKKQEMKHAMLTGRSLMCF